MNPQYVVYITFYRGNLLPPFYIGYTTESKVLSGYNGSVASKEYKAIWRRERAEHPDLFKTIILQRFETDVEALAREEFLHTFFDVPRNPLYINKAISRHKFGSYGRPRPDLITRNKKGLSPETRLKIGAYVRTDAIKQKMRKPKSDDHKKKLRLAILGVKRSPYKCKVVTCPHCGKVGNDNIMRRYHFNKCKKLTPPPKELMSS